MNNMEKQIALQQQKIDNLQKVILIHCQTPPFDAQELDGLIDEYIAVAHAFKKQENNTSDSLTSDTNPWFFGGKSLLHSICQQYFSYHGLKLKSHNKFHPLSEEDGNASQLAEPTQTGPDTQQKEAAETDKMSHAHLLARVDRLLSTGASVEEANIFGEPLLYVVARFGDAELLESLLARGALVDARSVSEEHTPLHVAILQGHDACVNLLIQHGADVNALSRKKKTPLHIAALHGRSQWVTPLIKAGAQINEIDDYGNTALQLAVSHSREDFSVVKILLEHQADQTISNKNKDFPLHTAIKNDASLELLRLLMQGASPEVMRCLNREGNDPLYLALGHLEDEKLALFEPWMTSESHAESLSQTYEKGMTLLHQAIWSGKEDLVKKLIKAGASIHAQDQGGNTPIHYAACFTDSVPLLKFLITRPKGNLSIASQSGSTVLEDLVRRDKKEMVQCYLEHSSEGITLENKEGRTPLDVAYEQKNTEVMNLLLHYWPVSERKSMGQRMLKGIISRNDVEMMKVLLHHPSVSVNDYTLDNAPLLHHCINQGLMELLQLMIHRGADLDIRHHGQNALEFASYVHFQRDSVKSKEVWDYMKNVFLAKTEKEALGQILLQTQSHETSKPLEENHSAKKTSKTGRI